MKDRSFCSCPSKLGLCYFFHIVFQNFRFSFSCNFKFICLRFIFENEISGFILVKNSWKLTRSYSNNKSDSCHDKFFFWVWIFLIISSFSWIASILVFLLFISFGFFSLLIRVNNNEVYLGTFSWLIRFNHNEIYFIILFWNGSIFCLFCCFISFIFNRCSKTSHLYLLFVMIINISCWIEI